MGADIEAHALRSHPSLLLEPAVGIPDERFCLEKSAESTDGEVLDMIELDLNSRDTEIQDLKAMAFNRERAEGVAAIENALDVAQERLKNFADLEEALSHQRDWQSERARHLQRI